MQNILQTKDLSKRYGKFTALNRANITIRKGDIYGLVGKNGAGKTTLMKLITGLSQRSSGELSLFDETTRSEQSRSRIGAIVETPEFFPYLSGAQNLEYFRIQRGIVERDAVATALAEVELTDAATKKFKTYSLGMKQRLGLALALMGSPDFLILDEPINGIDPEGIVHIRQLLKKLNEEKHITILISSHILTELANLATRFAIIDKGVILEELTAEELSAKSQSYIEIVVDNPKLALAQMEQQLGIKNYFVDAQNHIILHEGFERTAEMSRLLVQQGFNLYEIKQRKTTLEEYFMSAIGEGHHA